MEQAWEFLTSLLIYHGGGSVIVDESTGKMKQSKLVQAGQWKSVWSREEAGEV
jgi:hypothetical protein